MCPLGLHNILFQHQCHNMVMCNNHIAGHAMSFKANKSIRSYYSITLLKLDTTGKLESALISIHFYKKSQSLKNVNLPPRIFSRVMCTYFSIFCGQRMPWGLEAATKISSSCFFDNLRSMCMWDEAANLVKRNVQMSKINKRDSALLV